jgi:hypothetical protein
MSNVTEAMQRTIDIINASGTKIAKPHPTIEDAIIVTTIDNKDIGVVVGEFKHNPYTKEIMAILENEPTGENVVIQRCTDMGATKPIPFVLHAPPPLATIPDGGKPFYKDKKPNTGFKLGSYTYKSKRK